MPQEIEWQWVICPVCGQKTVSKKYCIKCGADLEEALLKPPKYRYAFNVLVVKDDDEEASVFMERFLKVFSESERKADGHCKATHRLDGFLITLSLLETDLMSGKPSGDADAALLVFSLASRPNFIRTLRNIWTLKTNQPKIIMILSGIKPEKANMQVKNEEITKIASEHGLDYVEINDDDSSIKRLRNKLIKRLLLKKLEQLRSVENR